MLPDADSFPLTVALCPGDPGTLGPWDPGDLGTWGPRDLGTDALSRVAVPLIPLERLYLLVDEFIRADRCAGTIPLAKLFQIHRV
jgi:hypothetical protein